jgi:hypothetical protein
LIGEVVIGAGLGLSTSLHELSASTEPKDLLPPLLPGRAVARRIGLFID